VRKNVPSWIPEQVRSGMQLSMKPLVYAAGEAFCRLRDRVIQENKAEAALHPPEELSGWKRLLCGEWCRKSLDDWISDFIDNYLAELHYHWHIL
jgi:hypothetical protein